MALWEPRGESIALLEGPLALDAQMLESALERVERVIAECHRHGAAPRVRLTGLLVVKAHRLGIATYSMGLDCIGQEAGALMRVLQEVYELLTYIRMDGSRVNIIIENGTPKAGAVGKAIGGSLKELREHF